MTTETTQEPQPPVMNVAEVYHILGRLEQAQQGTKEQLAEIKELFRRQEERNEQRFAQQEERNEQRFRDVNRRVDRLWYTIVGIGAALAVSLILQSVLGS